VVKQAYSEESIQEILTSKENNRGKVSEVFLSINTAKLLFHLSFSFTSLHSRTQAKSNTVWGYHVTVNLAGVFLMEGFNNMV